MNGLFCDDICRMIARKCCYFTELEGSTLHVLGKNILWDFDALWEEVDAITFCVPVSAMKIYSRFESRANTGYGPVWFVDELDHALLSEFVYGFQGTVEIVEEVQ